MIPTQENTPTVLQNKTSLVIFKLNHIHYAIAVETIQQIIEMVVIIPVLNTAAWMEGVINYHGVSIPIVNLRRHFGMEVESYHLHTPIILVNIFGHGVGLIVDDVLDVLVVSAQQVVDARSILPPGVPQTLLLKGVIQTEQNITLMLDLTHLFDQVQVRALTATTGVLDRQSAQRAGDVARPQKPTTSKRSAASKEKAGKTTKAFDTATGSSAQGEKS